MPQSNLVVINSVEVLLPAISQPLGAVVEIEPEEVVYDGYGIIDQVSK